jgi:hypothetical protein
VPGTTPAIAKLQIVEDVKANSSDSTPKKARTARDFNPEFHARVAQYFDACLSIRQTAEKFELTARTVNEILHARTFRKPVAREHSLHVMRRSA